LSKKGTVTFDPRTNTLIVHDVLDSVDRVTEIVQKLDSKTPQVMIEARIVEAATTFSREVGVQWGGRYSLNGGQTVIQGGDLTGGTGLSGNPLAVNLPANVKPGAGGALGFTFGNLSGTAQLDLQLSALEDTGRGRILSRPRVLTLDNKEAHISSGTEILIPTTSIVTAGGATGGGSAEGTTGVTTINAKLELNVTPHVTPAGEIAMHVKADKKDADYTKEVLGVPPLTTRSAETDLLVKDGETIVIGGIYTKTEQVEDNAVPWLSKIPIVGWLFKHRHTIEDQAELLVFITPTIYQRP
jgi:type IV pilus assembly protein PilQ